jgi:putative heme-binding domain-containing protein
MQALAAEAELHGDAARGEMIYRQDALACIACHAIGGAGGKVGPDLTSIGASAPTDYLVEAMLYPGDKVKEGYHATLIATKDEQVVSGVVVMENDQELVVRNTANIEVSVAKSNVASRTNIGSLMPPGLIDGLLPQERLDLIKFLSVLGKPGRFDATRSNVARQWQVYLTWSRNRHLGVERVAQGDLSLPDWHTTYSRVDGVVPPVNFQTAFPRSNNADHLFFAVQFDAVQGGEVSFTLESKLDRAWLNGTLVEIGDTFTLNAKAGTNTLVLRTDPKVFPENLRLSSDDVTFR